MAITGTLNTDAFKQYIKAQSTGGSFSSLPSRSRDDEEDDDSEQWATARPQHTPIKTTTLDNLFGEDAEAEHDRSQSSISTIKGKPKLTAEYLKSLDAGAEDDDEDADALLAGVPHHARLETDASIATIKPEAASKPSVGAGVRPESSSTMGMSTYAPSALVPNDTGMSTYGPPRSTERSRAPSILSAGGDDMRFSQWDMQGGAAAAAAANQMINQEEKLTSTTLDRPATPQAAKPAAAESSVEKAAAEVPASSQASSLAAGASATTFQPDAHSESPATLSSLLSKGRPARALFAINGEAAFNELSLSAGQTFQVISDDLQGGWSLAVVSDNTASEGWRRGLVPNGWYAFEREMLPPRSVEEPDASAAQSGGLVEEQKESHSGYIAAPTTAASRLFAAGQLHSPPILEQDLAPGTSLHPRDASRASLPRPSGPSRATQALSQLVVASPEHLRARSFDGRSDDGGGRAASMRRGPSNASIAVPEAEQRNSDGNGNAVADEQRASTSTLSPPRPTAFVQPFSRAFNRFSPFVSSGAEAYLLSPDPIVNYAPHRPRCHQKTSSSNGSSPSPNATVAHLRDTSATTLASQDEDGEDGNASADSARYEVESGPSGELRWRDQLPRFWVEVHDAHYMRPPKRRTGWLLGAPEGYVLYQVTTRFVEEEVDGQDADSAGASPPLDPSHPSSAPLQSLTVSRRFQHFVWLATHLSTSYPLIPLPPLPAKSRSRRFDRHFVEERRKVLATFLERVARHPVLRQDDAVTSFLTGGAAEAEDEEEGRIAATVGESIQEWDEWVIEEEGRQQYRQASATASTSASAADGSGHHLLAPCADFFARSLHKEFAIDAEDVESEWKAAERWNGLVEEAVSGSQQDAVLETMRRFREDALQAGEGYKALGRSLLRLTTTGGDGGNAKVTQRHSWCWRPHCPSCSILTSCMQETADALHDVGALQDQQARDALFHLHERLWSISRPHAVNADLWEVGKETLSRYELARNADAAAGLTQLQQQQQKTRTAAPAAKLPVETAELLASKAETVLNVCMAELDRVHEDKVEDWAKVGRDVLDGQIAFHRAALERLEAAREGWTDEAWRERGARQAAGIVDERSPYLAQLGAARVAPPAPLPQPSAQLLQPGVLERGILRPVGLAGDYFLSVMGLGTSAEGFNEEARAR